MHKAGEYIGDLVYGANDGIITTFAIVASSAGANLPPSIVVVLGVANMLADGFSMATSNYLARKSEQEYKNTLISEKENEIKKKPVKNALATFLAFVLSGTVPLLPYIFGIKDNAFTYAIIATSIALFTVGSLRTRITKTKWWLAGLEMLILGASAATVAYVIGKFLGQII
jgi:predicted membrane protein (TIGR00267 family)